MTTLEPDVGAPQRPATRPGTARALVRAMRPRQWLKNALVVGAPLAAGRLLEPAVAGTTALTFVALSLAASSTYLLNDVHDAAEDRLHPRKRHRPVASGALPVPVALWAAVVLGGSAAGVGALVGWKLLALLGLYVAITVAYTVRLRSEPVLDLVAVASGFLLRGAAGGVASGIAVSSWFLLVAGAGSLFLVSGKRFSERISTKPGAGGRATLALYSPAYLRFVWASSATLTIITYALWANDVYAVRDEGAWALWSLLPFVIGILRYAHDVDRGRAEAPEELLVRDRTLQAVGVIWLVMLAVGAGGMGG